ncbi:MAG: tetratricopeptide repeat protein [Micrococcales bacterium]|nr:tetratricopeptide repeat protein [Micrococcales bacterium]
MAHSLVRTKFHAPRPRPGNIARPRLDAILRPGDQARLTLISAPAGFGKTTVLASWLATRHKVAWLSLAAGDDAQTTFWVQVVAALQTVDPDMGRSAASLLQSPQPAMESILTTLVNELSELTHDVHLVLDDYHLADGPGIHEDMAFLLEHLPPQAHLVISTRADPALPLARLRARGELVEVRAADLRFSPQEAGEYLGAATGRDLDPADVEALEQRTEGWIAALQLAALSLQGREDVTRFVAGFTGDDRYVVDYLVEEVLQRQPEQIRDFLLRTSILDRLCGPLCDAVTGQAGGRSTLQALDRANLFLVPLDDTRQWYRYHHLFGEVLQTHLLDEHPDDVRELHGRASRWYDDAGEPVPAVRHALAAGDAERAADLMELALPALRRDRQDAVMLQYLDALPKEVLQSRPVLAMGLVGVLMARSEFDAIEDRLRGIERALDAGDPISVVDHDEFARLPGELELYRAALALVRGDGARTVDHAARAVERAAADDHLTRGGAYALQGLSSWSSGDLTEAQRTYSAAVDELLSAGHIADVLGCSIALSDILITQGRLNEAARTYEHALLLTSDSPIPLRGTPDMYVGLAQIACERDDLPAALDHLHRAEHLGDPMGLPQYPYRRLVALAGIRHAEGDLRGAADLLAEAERVYAGDYSPEVRPVGALRARVLITQGRLDEARAWVRRAGLRADDDVAYARECEHITLARLLLADADELAGSELLERLLASAEAGGRTGSIIEILILQALAHRDPQPLERALRLAEPEGYARTFINGGEKLEALLRAVTKRQPRWPFPRRLLAAPQAPLSSGLAEPLSEREAEVLRLLGTDLSGPQIADHLVVSLNTLRTHTKHIYAKLDVTSRRAAVRRAAELGVL